MSILYTGKLSQDVSLGTKCHLMSAVSGEGHVTHYLIWDPIIHGIFGRGEARHLIML